MKKRFVMTTLALMLLTAAVTYGMAFYMSKQSYETKIGELNRRSEQYAKIAEVQGYIDKYYVNEYDEKSVTDGAAAGMVAYLGDKWSYYLTADQFADLNESLNNKLVGIGVNVAYDVDSGGILVYELFPDTPAEDSGLLPMDVIYEVDGVPVSELGYDAAVNKVRGEEGTAVKLSVYRESTQEYLTFNVTRENVQIEAINSQILTGGIGYVKIRNFDLNVDKSFAESISNLQKANVKAIVFDVRNNPGGALQSLVACLDILLPETELISAVDKAGEKTVYKSDAKFIDLPMAVITNEHSISAAEFFAASLQEHDKAEIVGMPTTGKGCSQVPIQLKDGSGIMLSTQKYYTAKGISLAETGGIVPDHKVELTKEEQTRFYKLTQAQDRQLQTAVDIVKAKIPA